MFLSLYYPAKWKPAMDRDIFFFIVESSSLGQLKAALSGASIRWLSNSKWILTDEETDAQKEEVTYRSQGSCQTFYNI